MQNEKEKRGTVYNLKMTYNSQICKAKTVWKSEWENKRKLLS